MSAAARSLCRHARLISHVALYELQKATAFRAGFLVREVLRSVSRPVVMVFVYLAIASDRPIGGYAFADLVKYVILAATFEKILIHERAFELSAHIFEGTITKFLVMPFRVFSLILGRFAQYETLQLLVAGLFFTLGALLLPRWWPVPDSAARALAALILVLLGSVCYLLMYSIVHTLAFWLDVVWTLLVACRFVTLFVSGALVPVALMPEAFRAAFAWIFPYWALSAPIEIVLHRLSLAEFWRGVAVLLASAMLLEAVRRILWRRGVLQYTGSGM